MLPDTNTADAEHDGPPAPVLRLDKSRIFSTVHGQPTPDDPSYLVKFWQDDLPFDVNGILVPDDGTQQNINSVDAENKPVTHRPLYTDARRRRLALKMERLAKHARAPRREDREVQEIMDSDPTVRAAAAADVNLEAWLRGEMNYEPYLIFAAFETRTHHKTHKISEVVNELVLDENIVRPDEVVPYLARHLPADVRNAA